MELSFGRLALMTTLLAPSAACQGIAGTSAFEACDECGAGGGGGAGGAGATSSSTGTGASGATTGTGSTGTGTATCAEVTVTVEALGDVRIEIDPDDVDFDADETQTHCLPFGSKTISAECRPDEGERYPLDVDWGNALCSRGSSCTFDLAAPQTFVVSGAACE